MKNPTGRLARWALELQQYDYTIRYRKGSQNVVPDLLSRINQDEHLETTEIAAEVMTEQTSNPWYKKLVNKVAKNPTDHPWYEIVGGRM